MIDALEYLSEPRPHLGIPEAPDMSRKPPIALPHMKRTHLAMLFNDLGYRTGAEIGVCWGSYSRCLSVNNPEATIYSIDPWEVYPEYLEDYTEEKMERIYAIARKKLEGTGCVIIRKFSMDAVKDFDDASLDFVYIDANHEFQHVTNDIAEWSKKVRPGGIVSGHDFTRYKRKPVCHVKSVVGGWAYSYGIKPWFVARGEHGSSWFWVKQ
jgi:predicted O-methyltransferase YrrM